MLKPALKRTVAATTKRVHRRRRRRVVVLCYHSIHPRLPFASADPTAFARHLEWLSEHCDVVPLAEIHAAAASDRAGRARPVVAITFDDGYEDNFTIAAPLLSEAGFPATFFLTVGLVERDAAVVRRMAMLRDAAEEDVRGMTWDQVGEILSRGLTIGSHTYSHANLARVGRSEAADEILRARAILEERLDASVPEFAYPFGKRGRQFTSETMQLVRQAGHSIGAAVLFRAVKPTDDALAIPRFFVSRDDVETLRSKVEGDLDLVGLWQERAPAWLARVVSPADFR